METARNPYENKDNKRSASLIFFEIAMAITHAFTFYMEFVMCFAVPKKYMPRISFILFVF